MLVAFPSVACAANAVRARLKKVERATLACDDIEEAKEDAAAPGVAVAVKAEYCDARDASRTEASLARLEMKLECAPVADVNAPSLQMQMS